MTYVDNLLQDTGLGNTSELQTEGAGRAVCSMRGVLKDDLGEVRCYGDSTGCNRWLFHF